ncbi:hypothetical protein F4775DRAFT_241813 [Biscogniauxia sp. FL1348]|nr:hypothetical protein F4775DRAFT_241813 [Biscogniauxia sp. FL1348]
MWCTDPRCLTMDDSALDLPSSPDPLADEVPTSVRTGTRRTTLTLPPQPDQTLLSSSPRRSAAPRQSPRKRTFELDVGDENAPQRILVTVEAEEALRRGLVPRKLFVPSSPTQGSLLRKNTTTTTVPLNDEDDTKTPRRRGRPRRTSNGTPMPSGRKRSGTPIQRATKHARHSGGMESEANRSSDAPMDMDTAIDDDDADDTPRAKPKAKPKPRKTPKKSTATPAAPSSQVSGKTTGRKRGRPRKSLMPEEVVDLAKARADASMLAAGGDAGRTTRRRESASEVLSDFVRGGDPREAMSNDDAPMSDVQMGEAGGEQEANDTPRANMYHEQGPDSIQRRSESRTSSHQEVATDHDFMSEDAPGMELHSDTDSDMDRVEGVTYNGQDTLAHASDFSMIAVESLPSFQASFNANISGIPEEADELGDQEELGEQTSLIIQETLKSLRESTQANKSHQSSSHQTADNATTEQDRLEALNRSLEDNSNHSIRELSKSPRRPKSVPLNRQVFAGKAPHVDDSFSTLPDSILHAATPGRLPMKPTSASDHVGNDETYEDDSFSEIPDVVLEAATPKPKPAARTTMPPPQPRTENQAVTQNSNTSSRSPASNLGTARLPTPDDTSSSNAGSFRANENDNAAGSGAQAPAPVPSNSHLDMPSSPSAMTRPRAMDYGPSEMQDDMNGAPRRERASSELSPTTKPASDKDASDRSKSLEAPIHGRRPTLSPIVRVGRTLQNVMSDRSSPDGRESSLGSPFRGSYNNEAPRQHPSDPSRQSSAPRSPASSSRHHRRHSYTQPSFQATASLAQSIGPSSSQGQRRSSHDVVSGYADAFGESIQNPSSQLQRNGRLESRSTVKNPTRIIPPSDNEIDWLAEVDSPHPRDSRLPASEQIGSRNTSTFTSHGAATSQNMPSNITEPDRMQVDGFDESGDDAGQGGGMPDIDDDFDLWDIEASRPSPDKAFSEHEPEAEQVEPESDGPARRNKVISPWRRSGRRLIFKDDITSALQIEIGEDSGRSETEEDVMTRRRQQPRINKPTVQEQQPPQEEPEREPIPPEQYSPEESSKESSPSEEDDLSEQFSDHSSPEMDLDEQEWEPESNEQELPAFSGQPDSGSQSGNLQQSSEPANLSEYSMVQQPAKEPEPEPEPEAPTTQKKPAQAKSRFFGGFDILSFFSSPATLPQKDGAQTQSTETPSRPQRVEKPKVQQPQPKQPQASLWSTGLFRPIPQKEFRPSPERRIDLFSPGPAQRSRNTIPGTDAASPSASHRSSPSTTPSTPDRQEYPIIEQKKNFTPRQGQSKTSLFTSGQAISEAGQNGPTNAFLQVPSDDPDPESSILTEGSEYERLPPRDKPSRWDRTLSPSKSCFRSPLKPTTPGRVVAFTGNATSPSAQGQARVERQLDNNVNVSISQEPPVRLSIEGGESQLEQIENNPVNIVSNQSVPSVHVAPVPDPEPRQSARERLEERRRERAQARMERQAGTNSQPPISRPSLSTSTSASGSLPSLSNPTTATTFANRASSSSSESSSSSSTNNNNNNAIATLNPRPRQLQQRRQRLPPPPLSPTTWTKQHWIRLDEILQLRRRTNPVQFHQRFPLLPPHPDPEKRSALVGQEVVARDARMAIENWHMDVVDAFRLELELESADGDGDEDGGGCAWDERSLAKRLFALIVGEERRRDGRVVGSGSGGGNEERRGYVRGYGGFDI